MSFEKTLTQFTKKFLFDIISVGYNLNYNNYTWKREPYLKKDINLDNHAVTIEEYSFAYTSDGKYKYLNDIL